MSTDIYKEYVKIKTTDKITIEASKSWGRFTPTLAAAARAEKRKWIKTTYPKAAYYVKS